MEGADGTFGVWLFVFWRGLRCVADAGTDRTPVARTGLAMVTRGLWEAMVTIAEVAAGASASGP